jgi:hypothetical protein
LFAITLGAVSEMKVVGLKTAEEVKKTSQIEDRTLLQCESCHLFSSPELKAQVSFSDRPLSGVRLSVRL